MLYADTVTPSMRRAMDETERRRQIRTTTTRRTASFRRPSERTCARSSGNFQEGRGNPARRGGSSKLSERERDEEIRKLEKQMQEASRMLEFEYAAVLRDRIIELRKEQK